MSSNDFFECDAFHETSFDGTESNYSGTIKLKRKRARLGNEKQKRKLTAVMKKEELIWNRKHKLHRNSNALNSAWKRVANNMVTMNVEECRVMWKSIRDALRYRKKIAMRNGIVDNSDSIQFFEDTEENECDMTSSIPMSENSESSKGNSIVNLLNDEDNSENFTEKLKGIQNEEEKKVLAEVIKNEKLIWNMHHDLHLNSSSVESAWRRIAKKMYPMTVSQCKLLWKNMRDTVHYKKIVTIKDENEESGDFAKEVSLFPSSCSKLENTILSCDTVDDGETRFSRFTSNNSHASEQSERSVKIDNTENIFLIEGIKVENDGCSIQESITTVDGADSEKSEIRKTVHEPRRYNLKNEKEKRMLVELLKIEKVIWDIDHELHFSNEAVDDAWKRVANQMPNKMSVDKCKLLWRSLRDALRYRRKLAIKEKRAKNGSEKYLNESDSGNLLQDVLSLFAPNKEKLRNNDTLPLEPNIDTNHSKPDSSCSYGSQNNESDQLSESLANISKAVVNLITIAKNTQSMQEHAGLKYDYVWRLVESLYVQMDESTVNDLNQKIINLVFEYCKAKD